jgi:hypothetical protein
MARVGKRADDGVVRDAGEIERAVAIEKLA